MEYDIPPTTFLPIEQDNFSNYGTGGPEENSHNGFLQDAKDVLIVLSVLFVGVFTIFTLIGWLVGERTLKETLTHNLNAVKSAPGDFIDYVKELANRKSLEEIKAEQLAARIRGKSIIENWEGTNINTFKYIAPDTAYLETPDLYGWYHPKMIATISLASPTIIYNGTTTAPISVETYSVSTAIDSIYFNR